MSDNKNAEWLNGRRKVGPRGVGPNLVDAVRMWPTPTTQEVEHPEAELTETGRRKSKNGNTSHSLGLADAVQKWPTPVASDAWTGDLKSTQQTEGSRHSLNLSTAVQKYPTMSASGMGNTGSQQMLQKHVDSGSLTEEEKRGMTAGNGGRLNPTWVEWLMGFPTGWTDLEDSETP
jgi:DNA (cytosine-5)-methyltransferase 1